MIALLLALELAAAPGDMGIGPSSATVLSFNTRSSSVLMIETEGSPESIKWPAVCHLRITQQGDVRIVGVDQAPCIAALELAARLAKAERKVNAKQRRSK